MKSQCSAHVGPAEPCLPLGSLPSSHKDQNSQPALWPRGKKQVPKEVWKGSHRSTVTRKKAQGDAAPPGSESDRLQGPPLGESRPSSSLDAARPASGRVAMGGGGPRPRVSRTREATLPPQLSSSLFLPDRPGLSKASRGHCPPWGPADARLRHDGDHLHPKEDAGGGGAEGGHRPAADHVGLAPVGGLGASRVLSISSTLECISSANRVVMS